MNRALPIAVESAAVQLRALANPARLGILLTLLAGEQSVGALELSLGLRQPNLSQHLGELREVGLVVARREARAVIYGLADNAARRLAAALVQGFGGTLAAPPPVTAVDRPGQSAPFATVGGSE